MLQAIGGSTNGLIHLTAMANRTEHRIDLEGFDQLGREVPVLVDLKPSGDHYMEHFHHAGGVPKLMAQLGDLIDLDAKTITGADLRDVVATAEDVPGQDVIRARDNPIKPEGAMAVLHGNLAPRGAVIKQSAASPKLLQHTGRAVVFEFVEDMTRRAPPHYGGCAGDNNLGDGRPLDSGPSTARSVLVDGREAVDGEVLVQFRDEAAVFEQARAADEIDADEVESLDGHGTRRIRALEMHTQELLARLRANPDVEFAEPNYIIRLAALPNDPYLGNLWGLLNSGQDYGGVGVAGADVDATLAWEISTGSHANVIGIVDTGIDYNHPDLAANMWTAPAAFSVTIGGLVINCAAGTHGFNAITNTCNPIDDNDHGTHVAGTIGAVGNNGVGVVGLNWAASMMALKFLDSTGTGTIANAIKAIEFAVQAKAVLGTNIANVRVLSNSWNGNAFSQSLLNEINRSNTANMLFVAAAGNSGLNLDTSPSFPASFAAPNIIAVAATNNRDERASFSNYGAATVHLGAPGVAILSTTINNHYAAFSGTSMATPHVAGAAALLLSACSLTTAELKAVILNAVDPTPAMAGATTTGGRLNVNNAIRTCAPSPTISVPNVVGLTQAAATTSLTSVGLAVGTVTTASSPTVPAGRVISQTPVSGASVAVGSAVNLTVSWGPSRPRA